MSLFATGLEYLIQHLQDRRSPRHDRFPRDILDRITSFATTAVDAAMPLVQGPAAAGSEPGSAATNPAASTAAGETAGAVLEAADPWAVPAETASVQPSEPVTLESLRARAVECRKCPHLAAFRH